MMLPATENRIDLQALRSRKITAQFDGGDISSDGGGILLREIDSKINLIDQISDCFRDCRDPDRIDHSIKDLVSQRVFGIILGYEDLNDHDRLRYDPLMAAICGKEDPTGSDRSDPNDKGKALAGKSTLNRLETTPFDADEKSRYKKIVASPAKLDELLVKVFLDLHVEEPKEIVLDLDVTDDPVHGNQEGRFFHGYYKSYCFLPLYVFCGSHLLAARLRTSDIDPAEGVEEELGWIVEQIRRRWENTRIVVRGDSGFCRNNLLSWCEENKVDYVFGLPKNQRLERLIAEDLVDAEFMYRTRGRASRVYNDFNYKTLKSWDKERRVVSKGEYLPKGANPRFVVTSIPDAQIEAKDLYEKVYCARGEMENRIKEQQLGLFADRTSSNRLRSNQIRLYFSSFAYVLMNALREYGLKGTQMAKAQVGTIREKLLKIGAKVKVTVRRVWISLAESYPWRSTFMQVIRNITKMRL